MGISKLSALFSTIVEMEDDKESEDAQWSAYLESLPTSICASCGKEGPISYYKQGQPICVQCEPKVKQ